MPILVLPPRYTEDSISLWRTAKELGWKVERLVSWRMPPNIVDSIVVIYGESLFAAVVSENLEISLIEPTFDWLVKLPLKYLKRQIQYKTLGQLEKIEEKIFIKPADDKCFRAKIYEQGEIIPSADLLPSNTPILISEVVNWMSEFRSFIIERSVATISVYARNGKTAQDDEGNWFASKDEIIEAKAFIENFLADSEVALPPSVVVDIGFIADRGWAVIEANPSWGSGIYGCDPYEVLKVISRASIKTSLLTNQDKQWIINRS
ncbi:MAG: ATP-grasp domain-containing protein [Blastocatellia bacterium]|nr:ATP-grasp domain-containing protein [Blastocatellia bacterium]MBL8196487.1 ATP-grasp domain-containing protein [Blastocatellia bacterium]